MPDSIAYFKAARLDAAACDAPSRRMRYAGVFLLERLGFEKDPVRAENDRAAARLESLLAAAYQELGYTPVPVPVWPVRADFILELVSKTPDQV